MLSATRRGVLGLAAGSSALLLPARGSRAVSSSDATMDEACVLTPQSEAGPYYLDPKLIRSDIAEGRSGVPLSLRLRVIEAGSCTPVASARVDVWHCDARGLYSAFPNQGDGRNVDQSSATFLRGSQAADASGWVAFNTIYPGWYAGRTTHIHFKVILDERSVLTGQTFFPEAINEFIYTNVPDYTGRPKQRLVINANDRIAAGSDPEHRAWCAVREARDRYVATLTLAVDRNAQAAEVPMGAPSRAPWIKDRLAALVPGLKRSPF